MLNFFSKKIKKKGKQPQEQQQENSNPLLRA